jgi:phage shock protein C
MPARSTCNSEVAAVRERLYRSRDDRMLFGVAGGMADWLDVDPAVVRLVWALLVVFGGAGLLLYIVAAIVIPEEPLDAPEATPGVAASGAALDPATGAVGPAGAAAGVGAGQAMSYAQRRAERRAARRAARGVGGPSTAGIVFGVILVLVGGWLLLREVFPFFDDRFVGPAVLIGIGLLLVVAAVRRPASRP